MILVLVLALALALALESQRPFETLQEPFRKPPQFTRFKP